MDVVISVSVEEKQMYCHYGMMLQCHCAVIVTLYYSVLQTLGNEIITKEYCLVEQMNVVMSSLRIYGVKLDVRILNIVLAQVSAHTDTLSVCLSVCPSACLPACLPVCLSVCLSVCL